MWPFKCLSKEEKAVVVELARKARREREQPLRDLLRYTPFTFICGRVSSCIQGLIQTRRYDTAKEFTIELVTKLLGADGFQGLLEQNEGRRLRILDLERNLENAKAMLVAKKRLAKKGARS